MTRTYCSPQREIDFSKILEWCYRLNFKNNYLAIIKTYVNQNNKILYAFFHIYLFKIVKLSIVERQLYYTSNYYYCNILKAFC